MAEARGRGVDQRRVARVQALPAEPELLHHARAVVLDQDVGAGEQPAQDGEVVPALQVERDALLAAVDGEQVPGLAVEPGTERAREIAPVRVLHLDDPGAQVAEDERAVGAREDAGEIHDRDAGKRARDCHLIPPAA